MGINGKILCVEDEALLLCDIKEELEEAGYTVFTANNGTEAIGVLQNETPHLILCDMMMPSMDGSETLEHIRSHMPEHDNVPFIFLTAKATRDDIVVGKLLGVDDYLTKPIDYEMLVATVEARLREVRRLAEKHQAQLYHLRQEMDTHQPSSGPFRVTIVTGNEKFVAPIKSALDEFGCIVNVLPEERLAKTGISTEKDDIIFLVYSRIVHYFINQLIKKERRREKGKLVLLAPPKLTEEQRNEFLETGIDKFIEYPYRPAEIFKLIVPGVQDSHAMAG